LSNESLISSNVDYEREGKQIGRLAVPQSTNSAGWANYYIPIAVVKNGEGPTALLFGGNHGDEYEGPVTLMKMLRRVQTGDIQGRLIIVPMLNRPAVLAGTRLSPLDGMNMNRAYPGRADGSITSMIAHYVTQELLPRADVVIDIHSGGSSMHMLPSVNMHRLENQQQMDQMLAAARAWEPPYIFIYRDVAGAGLLPSLAEQMGKVTLGTEVGSKAQFGPEMLRITETGVHNTLHWAGILKQAWPNERPGEGIVVEGDDVRDYVMAPVSGLYEPLFEIGDRVEAGQVIGRLHDLESVEREALEVRCETEGLIFCRRSIPLTAQGECLAVVVREV